MPHRRIAVERTRLVFLGLMQDAPDRIADRSASADTVRAAA
jgi:hypothetical protein